jgi:membrane peptidoglycan carboxypeptidase
MLYLVGIEHAIGVAKKLGIKLAGNADQYGLTLVLGGGEVSLLDMTSAYGVFANDGMRLPHTPLLKVMDKEGVILQEFEAKPEQVMNPEATRVLNSVLSDNAARSPLFGPTSFMYFGDRYDVAAKTGTTNSNRDAWLIGYSPSLAVGVWSGNNDNSAMKKGSSISGPAWRQFMDVALPALPNKRFIPPSSDPTKDMTLKPILRGIWAGGESVTIDTISGKLATDRTPVETRKELIKPNAHSILHWVVPGDPRGPGPANPTSDSQYEQWEYGVRQWVAQHGYGPDTTLIGPDTRLPTTEDDVHVLENIPSVNIVSPLPHSTHTKGQSVSVRADVGGHYDARSIEIFLDDMFVGSADNEPFSFSFVPSELSSYHGAGQYRLKVVAVDDVYNRSEEYVEITLQ